MQIYIFYFNTTNIFNKKKNTPKILCDKKSKNDIYSKIYVYICKQKLLDNLLELIIMAKYNISPKKEKDVCYMNQVNQDVLDRLERGIIKIIVKQKKYKDKDYSAKKLVADIGTNSRYISAVLNKRFHCNYATLVNNLRIEDAKTLLADERYQNVRIEDIGSMVGFSNRQSFYGAFYERMGMTPKKYKEENIQKK